MLLVVDCIMIGVVTAGNGLIVVDEDPSRTFFALTRF
jgi:hypothetical protein